MFSSCFSLHVEFSVGVSVVIPFWFGYFASLFSCFLPLMSGLVECIPVCSRVLCLEA